jgi:hypothetical protein
VSRLLQHSSPRPSSIVVCLISDTPCDSTWTPPLHSHGRTSQVVFRCRISFAPSRMTVYLSLLNDLSKPLLAFPSHSKDLGYRGCPAVKEDLYSPTSRRSDVHGARIFCHSIRITGTFKNTYSPLAGFWYEC